MVYDTYSNWFEKLEHFSPSLRHENTRTHTYTYTHTYVHTHAGTHALKHAGIDTPSTGVLNAAQCGVTLNSLTCEANYTAS